jgi:hypothetical protein
MSTIKTKPEYLPQAYWRAFRSLRIGGTPLHALLGPGQVLWGGRELGCLKLLLPLDPAHHL